MRERARGMLERQLKKLKERKVITKFKIRNSYLP